MGIRENPSLTAKQQEVLGKIAQYIEEKGQSPTVTELSQILRVSSLRTVTQYLESLERKGLISRARYQNRGIRVLNPIESRSETITLPVISAAGCGNLTILAEHIFDEYITVAKDFLQGKKREEAVVIKAVGKSMVDAGIEDGDFVLTEVTKDVVNGDKVVAVIDDMAVIKKYAKTDNAIILSPMSPDPEFTPIIMKENFEVFGKVIDVIKHPKNNELTYEPIST